MNDCTILFYSCNRLPEPFAEKVRTQLLKSIGDLPLISITFKPLEFGQNICIGERERSTWQLYQQIYIGALAARTEYVAMAEDDCLVTPEHFQLRPSDKDTFLYDQNRWWAEEAGFFRWRDRTVQSTCIAPRELLIETLETRFRKFPEPPTTREELHGFGECGRYERYLKLPRVKMEKVYGPSPLVTFNLKGSLGGLRKTSEHDICQPELEPWGSATKLWSDYVGA